MKSVACFAALILCATAATAAIDEDGFGSVVSVKTPPFQDSDRLIRQWERLPAELRKKIGSEMLFGEGLGLSSTGKVQLIGVYHQKIEKGENAQPKRLFHLRQVDLSGLFWSALINTDDHTYRVLFRAGDTGDNDTTWRKLRDSSPPNTTESKEQKQ